MKNNTIIPESVTSIGENAFLGCTGLTSITIPESITSIGFYAFEYCENLKYNEYDNALYLGNDENPYLCLIKHKGYGGDLTSCIINDKTRIVCDYAFNYCSSLTSINIPESVTSIGNHAFWDCIGLTSITIPSSVTSIGNMAFYDCFIHLKLSRH